MGSEVLAHKKVLVIDDDRVDRLMVRELLSSHGFLVPEAQSEEEACRVLAEGGVDCVLLDYNIPGTDAIGLLSRLVADKVPVVMLTGEGNEAVAVETMKQGAQDYINKGRLTEESLVRAVRGSIKTVELRRELERHQEELANVNEQLKEKLEQLETINGDLRAFVHLAAHDFREPLQIMHNYCDLLDRALNQGKSESAQSFLEAIRRGAKRLAHLVDGLRTLTKIDHSNLVQEELDLKRLVEEVVQELDVQIRERALQIEIAELPRVRGQKALIEELYRNLLANALKYGRPSGPFLLRLTAEVIQNEWVLGVWNNGSSIPKSEAEKIFQPFFRLLEHREIEGTGIGLTMCKKIVERHGGRIWLDVPEREVAHFLFTINGTPERG